MGFIAKKAELTVKHIILTIIAALFGVMSPAGQLFADELLTHNGSRLVGRVAGLTDGVWTVETEFAGTLRIQQSDVLSITTDEPRTIGLASGNVLAGRLAVQDGHQCVETTLGTLDITADTIVSLWRSGEESPEAISHRQAVEAQAGKWKHELSTDISGKTGNTERFATSAGFQTVLDRPQDKLKFYLRGQRAVENGRDTSNEIKGGSDYERIIADGHSWYTRVQFEHDEIVDLELRTSAAAGYGYYLFRRPGHELRLRGGLLFRHESYDESTGRGDDQTLGLDLGLRHMLQINGWTKLVTNLTCTPSFEDAQDYRVNHETSLEARLAGTELWGIRLGVANDYNSQPADDYERLDTTYFVRLILNWE